MLIISKFHDYYDTAIAYGVDKECVYDRTTKIVNPPRHTYNRTVEFSNKEYKFKFDHYILGFCGNLYRCVKVIQIEKYNGKEQVHGFYDADSLIKYMKLHTIGLTHEKYRWYRWGNHNWKSEADVKRFFDKEVKQAHYDIFRDNHVPVFVIDDNTITINPCLKDFKFGKIKDAVTVFQEIHQYLMGVLGNKELDTINVSDKTRIQQHGFNKWSFRKMPADSKKKIRKEK